MQTATLFHHDDSQAVQLPPEFQLPGTQVYIKQVGNALVLLPMDQPWTRWSRASPTSRRTLWLSGTSPRSTRGMTPAHEISLRYQHLCLRH